MPGPNKGVNENGDDGIAGQAGIRDRHSRGSERVGKIRFHIGIRAAEGEVTYSAADQELRKSIRTLLGRKRSWRWQDLTRKLIDNLSLSTGGRFVLRFGTTPSDEGRGAGEHGLRRAINRAVNE